MGIIDQLRITKEDLQDCLDLELTQLQMAERLNCTIHDIRDCMNKYELTPLGSSFHNSGDKNPAKQLASRQKISRTVKSLWDDGYYSSREVVKTIGFENPKFDIRNHYVELLSQYQDVTTCSRCGATDKINVHHVNEDHDNFLITNLAPLCVSCHQKVHLDTYLTPFVTLRYTGHFDSSHNLLYYNGPCKNLHGHRYLYQISIRNRIDPDTGMVLDFKVLKSKLKEGFEAVVDHTYLNNLFSFNSTAENMAVWMFEFFQKRLLIKGLVEVKLWETPDCEICVTDCDMLSYYNDKIERYRNLINRK